MNTNNANIDIIRDANSKLISVSVVMPIWDKASQDGMIAVNVPHFGIKTFAKDLNDAETAIKESLKAFCINAEKFGNGLESELKIMGWNFDRPSEGSIKMFYEVPQNSVILDQILETGDQFSEKLDLETAC